MSDAELAHVPAVRDKLKVGLRRALPAADGLYHVEQFHECNCPACDDYGHWLPDGAPVSKSVALAMIEDRRR